MEKRPKDRSDEFEILEEQGYDLEQFLCRCPNKTSSKQVEDILKTPFERDPLAVVTVTFLNPDTMAPIRTRAITTTLGLLLDGLRNIDQLGDILPRDPVAALYVLLTNNTDGHKAREEAAKFASDEGIAL